jgi:hypothetical protein
VHSPHRESSSLVHVSDNAQWLMGEQNGQAAAVVGVPGTRYRPAAHCEQVEFVAFVHVGGSDTQPLTSGHAEQTL